MSVRSAILAAVQLSQLTPLEQLALVGLVRVIAHADGQLSPAEVPALAKLAREIGSADFWRLMSHAQQELATTTEVLELAERVERPEVREWIYGVLVGLSAVDGMDARESEVLDRVMKAWGL